MASLGSIEHFSISDPKQWESYVERMEFFFTANGIADASKKRATFLSLCGPETYEILRSLVAPAKVADKTYEEIIKELGTHFSPKTSEIVYRFKFYRRDQQNGETFPVYLKELRKLAEPCGFEATLDTMLRDRIVCGIIDETLQKRLLATTDLKLADVTKMCVAHETATTSFAMIREGGSGDRVEVNALNSRKQVKSADRASRPGRVGKKCFRCEKDHAADSCVHSQSTCSYCKKLGHIAIACFKKKRESQNKLKVHIANDSDTYTEEPEISPDPNCVNSDYVFSINNVTPDKFSGKYLTAVSVNGIQTKMEVDSGAGYTIIGRSLFQKISNGNHLKLKKSHVILRDYQNNPIPTVGECLVEVRRGSRRSTLPLIITEGNRPSLLGRNWFQELGLTVSGVHTVIQQPGFIRVKRGYKPMRVENLVDSIQPHRDPTDPYFSYQWYLKNTGQNGGKAKLDLNVEAAWAQGVTGKNVTTAIMDDGVDYMHPDLKFNYNAKASYDFSSNDPYPYPRYTDDWFNSHGTRCAGEVAAARDNGICGVGVAYDSKIAGIRMLDQPYMTDLIEANSMGHEPNLIDIYSASWGPTDDGKTVDGPRNATMRAIVRGVNEGRNGLGNIYVWASGDGGEDDDCNCDGYAASMWTVSINSAINDGQNAHYDESCSSTLASTFSNGAKDPNTGVATTDLYGKCTTTHSGTSAAAPEAAGVFALALEANPQLSWRDIQHLTVLTSKRNSLFDAKGRFHWTMNGVGLEFNHLFGFGVLDAGAMVALAKQWKTVPPRYHCEAGSVTKMQPISSGKSLVLKIETKACEGEATELRYLEHVQAVVTVNASRRGDLELYLTSPMGTKSMILSKRPNDDDSHDGFTKWPFMTTHTWAEYPQGTWILEARFNSLTPQTGFFKEWTLMLHGTKEPPYTELAVLDPHSKLAIVKKAHESRIKRY